MPRRTRIIRRAVLVAAVLAALTTACGTDKERASFSGGVDTPVGSLTPGTDGSTTTTTLTAGSVVLSSDGLGPVAFGTQAARAMDGLTQALGRADSWGAVPAGLACAATRVFTWKNFDVFVNEVTAGSRSRPGLVGWAIRNAEPTLNLKTERGISVGSTVAAVKAAYGDNMKILPGELGPTLSITDATGSITGELDGLGDANKVRTLRAGTACAG